MTTIDPAPRTPSTDSDASYAALRELSAAPLWRHYGTLLPAEPKNRARPHVWHYAQLRPHALHFSRALSMDEAQRRVLMLINPALTEPPATVNTLFAGIQILMPGETAQAHRHTAAAFRFIIEGNGAYTTVNGERVPMRPGDLLLTPSWHWHDHNHCGDEAMMWLDGLDYPLVNALDAGFFEPHEQRTQRVTRPEDLSSRQLLHGRLNPVWQPRQTDISPIGNYRWTETKRALDAIADDAAGSSAEGIQLEYSNPWTGGPVMPTMSCRIARLRAGFRGASRRHTASTIYHVVSGAGSTDVDGQRLDWTDKDVFVVPGWAPYTHRVAAGRDAILFAYSDEPVLRALGLYREQWL